MSTRIPANDFEWTLKEFCEIPDQMGKRNTMEANMDELFEEVQRKQRGE